MLRRRIREIVGHFTEDIWVEDFSGTGRAKNWWVALARWLYLIGYGFVRDQCILRSTALTYTTTLSLAPFLAVAFSISKGLGLQRSEYIRDLLVQLTAGREELVTNILNYVDATNVKTLGFLGILILLVTAVSLVSTVETAFNVIWGVVHGRSVWRKFTDFFSVALITPLLIVAAVSLTVYLRSDAFLGSLLEWSPIHHLWALLAKAMPLFMIIGALFFLYVFVPNTRVRFRSALAGATVAGILWALAQWVYITYQVGMTRWNTIYGSFAQFPIFLVWLFISWVIVLLGAEMSFAVQNSRTFAREVRAGQATRRDRDKIAVLILLILARRFRDGLGPISNETMASCLQMPVKLVNEIMQVLASNNMVARAGEEEHGQGYVLGRSPAHLDIYDVMTAMSSSSFGQGGLDLPPRFAFIDEMFTSLGEDMRHSEANRTLSASLETLEAKGMDACLQEIEE